MIWEDDRVAAIIADADAAIGEPDISVGVSKLLLLNPINLIRGPRLYRRLQRNPDDASLAEVLPEDIYQRYTAVKAEYFPHNSDVDMLRPALAAAMIAREVQAQERLTGFEVITRHVDKLIRKNRDIRKTDVKVERMLEGDYRDLSNRLEEMTDSLPLQSEIDCFESQLTLFESHLNDIKEVANAWATGNARDIEDFVQPGSLEDPCSELLLTSSEGELAQELLEESRQRWLDAAVSALEHNRSTFTMLPVAYIKGSLSLVRTLAELGYTVHEPK